MFQKYAKSKAAMQDIPISEIDCERDYRLLEGRDKELYRFLLLSIMANDDATKTASVFFLTWDILEDAMPLLKPPGIYVIGGYDGGNNTLDSILRSPSLLTFTLLEDTMAATFLTCFTIGEESMAATFLTASCAMTPLRTHGAVSPPCPQN